MGGAPSASPNPRLWRFGRGLDPRLAALEGVCLAGPELVDRRQPSCALDLAVVSHSLATSCLDYCNTQLWSWAWEEVQVPKDPAWPAPWSALGPS